VINNNVAKNNLSKWPLAGLIDYIIFISGFAFMGGWLIHLAPVAAILNPYTLALASAVPPLAVLIGAETLMILLGVIAGSMIGAATARIIGLGFFNYFVYYGGAALAAAWLGITLASIFLVMPMLVPLLTPVLTPVVTSLAIAIPAIANILTIPTIIMSCIAVTSSVLGLMTAKIFKVVIQAVTAGSNKNDIVAHPVNKNFSQSFRKRDELGLRTVKKANWNVENVFVANQNKHRHTHTVNDTPIPHLPPRQKVADTSNSSKVMANTLFAHQSKSKDIIRVNPNYLYSSSDIDSIFSAIKYQTNRSSSTFCYLTAQSPTNLSAKRWIAVSNAAAEKSKARGAAQSTPLHLIDKNIANFSDKYHYRLNLLRLKINKNPALVNYFKILINKLGSYELSELLNLFKDPVRTQECETYYLELTKEMSEINIAASQLVTDESLEDQTSLKAIIKHFIIPMFDVEFVKQIDLISNEDSEKIKKGILAFDSQDYEEEAYNFMKSLFKLGFSDKDFICSWASLYENSNDKYDMLEELLPKVLEKKENNGVLAIPYNLGSKGLNNFGQHWVCMEICLENVGNKILINGDIFDPVKGSCNNSYLQQALMQAAWHSLQIQISQKIKSYNAFGQLNSDIFCHKLFEFKQSPQSTDELRYPLYQFLQSKINKKENLVIEKDNLKASIKYYLKQAYLFEDIWVERLYNFLIDELQPIEILEHCGDKKPLQRDSSSCGVITSQFILDLITGKNRLEEELPLNTLKLRRDHYQMVLDFIKSDSSSEDEAKQRINYFINPKYNDEEKKIFEIIPKSEQATVPIEAQIEVNTSTFQISI